MEILNNFGSIYCFIAFVIGAVFMLAIYSIEAMGKSREPRNKVHFYVTCELEYNVLMVHTLWIGKPDYTEGKGFSSDAWGSILAINNSFASYNLNYSDFADMKDGEIREVFINLED